MTHSTSEEHRKKINPSLSPQTSRHHYRTCNLCEAMCGIEIVVKGDSIQSIRGDSADPFSRGHICPKAVALQDIHTDPDRLRHPMRRTPTGWVQIGWDEALAEVASRFKTIQRQQGRDAIGVYLGNPTFHNYGLVFFELFFLKTLHTRNRFSTTSLDQLPHMLVSKMLFGHQALLPVPDVDRTNFFVIMGGNPVVSNGSLMSAPGIKKRLQAIRQRGGKVIVIDPRRTETAQIADQHLFIKPGTDTLLLLAVLNVLKTEKLIQPGRLTAFLEGEDVFWKSIQGITPEKVSEHTSIDPSTIRELARAFGSANRAVWYGRVGVSAQEFGTLTQWLIYSINILTGNLDRPGGAMFTRPALDLLKLPGVNRGEFGRWQSRLRRLPEFGDELPSVVMAEEMLTPGKGQIRAMLTIAGNPVLSSPNGRKLDKALAGLDYMVSIDYYINETTRHANIILPPSDALEHENYDVIFSLLAIRNTAHFSPALFKPEPDTRHDWEILLDLDTRLLANGPLSQAWAGLRQAILHRIGPEGLLDFGLRLGPYGAGMQLWKKALNLPELKKAVHGIDLGALESCLPGRLKTASKHIQLAPEVFLGDLRRLQGKFSLNEDSAISNTNPGSTAKALAETETPQGFVSDLVLIGRRDLRSNNSWMHNYERLVKEGDRCTLLMHPEDAQRYGVADGQQVRVTSTIGSITARVEVSHEIMPGVVSLPHGWGHARQGTQLKIAQYHPGVSVNDITNETAIDMLSGMAALNGVPVSVEPC